MTQSFRFIPLVAALTMASALIACTTAPAMTMGGSPAGGMAMADHAAKWTHR